MTRQVIFKQFSSLFRRKNMLPWSGYCCVLGLRNVLAFTFSMKFACIRWTKRRKKTTTTNQSFIRKSEFCNMNKLIFKLCWTIKGKFFATFKTKMQSNHFSYIQKQTCSLHNKLKKNNQKYHWYLNNAIEFNTWYKYFFKY